METMLPKNIT